MGHARPFQAKTSTSLVVALALWLLSPNSLLAQFPAPDDFNPGIMNRGPSAMAIQADGKILIGGSFTAVAGRPQYYLGRLNADGTLDSTFNPRPNEGVWTINVQADGRILVGGSFTALGGQPRPYLGRLNADGTLDGTFNSAPSWLVGTIAVQADGKILLGGAFNYINAQLRSRIARLNLDGTVDGSFDSEASSEVTALAVQPDGRVIVGGAFSILNGQSRNRIGRLNADGTLDDAFDPGADDMVRRLVIQPDGRILVAGDFSSIAGQPRNRLARLNADGTLDGSFNPAANDRVFSMALQSDGRILVGGNFTTVAGEARTRIARLHASGLLDTSFNPVASASVNSLCIQPDGKVLVGGAFLSIGGLPRSGLARLHNTDPAIQNLNYDGSVITWLRGGSSPEVWLTFFEHSTNGSTWSRLGNGERISGGWQLTGIGNYHGGLVRARGHVAGDGGDDSGWFVVGYFGPPLLTTQPSSLTNLLGTIATFEVTSLGTEPVTYQWFRDGFALQDGDNITGATSARLTVGVSRLFKADEGSYAVVLSNRVGSVTSSVATLTVIEPVITVNPVNASQAVGASATFVGSAIGTPPLSYQWLHDGVLVPGAVGPTLVLTGLTVASAGNYTMSVSNAYGTVTSTPALLTLNAGVERTFNPGASGTVYSLAMQAGGKILVGGTFTNLGGEFRRNIGRLNADGTLDTTFNPGAISDTSFRGVVSSIAVQPDGRLLVGGTLTNLGGQTRRRLGRLHADGTVDQTFNPGANGPVYSLVVQPDGIIIVGGGFTSLGEQTRNRIARLNPDGTLDGGFNPDASGSVLALALQADGKILVGGQFTNLAGLARTNIGRLNTDGTPDTTFNPGAVGNVYAFALQADGKILVGGEFTTLGGAPRFAIARLHADGTLDTNFNPRVDRYVYSMAVQADGKILLGGTFDYVGAQRRQRIARLNADGMPDPSFDPIATGSVLSLAVQADGKVLVGGLFDYLGGPRNGIARLHNTHSATQTLSHADATFTWLRGGTTPVVTTTRFEHSSDGMNWTLLGVGEQISGGWQMAGVDLPANGTVRARGQIAGGYSGASTWFAETYLGVPAFVYAPTSRTNIANTTATFTTAGVSAEPLSYQWLKNGVPLVDHANVAGANSTTLTLSQVLAVDEGAYTVALSNSFGSVTSAVATLKVIDPFITQHPASLNPHEGETVMFYARAIGTPPLSYQWYHAATAVAGGVGSTLTLQSAAAADAGLYLVVVSNAHGSVTSSPALLSVNAAKVDASFNPGASNGVVNCLAVQPDGSVVVGGAFNTLGGQARRGIGRLDSDGALDVFFDPVRAIELYTVAIQPDGKILIGGDTLFIGVQSFGSLGRFNADGTLDSTFNCNASWHVTSLTVLADDKILMGGIFTRAGPAGGQPRDRIARLNADATLDSSFNPGADSGVHTMAVQEDGKVLIGGTFSILGGEPRKYIGRLNADGTLDGSFDPGANGWVSSIAVQADGKILLGSGAFNTVAGQPRIGIARLNADGTLDSSFNPGANGSVSSIAVQADGKILVGGSFTTLGGQLRYYLGRLNGDGTVDGTFNPGANGHVLSLALQSDGAILVGGQFASLDGQPRSRIARLNNTSLATQTLSYDGTNVTWQRNGSSPEVWRTTFDHSVDGMAWTNLGAGKRISSGWQLSDVSLHSRGILRARGYSVGGKWNSSGGIVESVLDLAIRLRLVRDGPLAVLSWTGGRGPYQVQETTDASQHDSWLNLGPPVQTNSISLPIGSGSLFLRVRGQ